MFHTDAKLALEKGDGSAEREVPPTQGGGAYESHVHGAGDSALPIHVEVGYTLNARGRVRLTRSTGNCAAALGLANAAGEGELPIEMSEWTVARTGVEVLFLPVYIDDGYIVVELRETEIARKEETAIAIRDHHEIGLHAGGAGHGDEELRPLVAAAAFTGPDVVGGLYLVETRRLLF